MLSTNDFSTINALNLEPIKEKLTHQKAGKGWSPERANAVELEYRRFLCLVKKFPNEPIAPVVDVDEFWHYHILDTRKYADDCEQVFGYFLHHFPYAGMRGKEDEEALQRIGARTGDIYEQTFGIAYVSELAAASERPRTAMSAAVRLSGAYNRPGAEAAYCYVTAAKPAYCYVTAAVPAYCFVTGAPTATCDAAVTEDCCVAECDDHLAAGSWTGTATTAQPAYCWVATAPAATRSSGRLPEQRAGFYLEMPRLAVACS
jgi:hypothetical protein